MKPWVIWSLTCHALICLPADAQMPPGKRGFSGFGMSYPATNVIGVLVVRVNCEDAEIPASERDLRSSVFGEEDSINAIFKYSSYGKWRVEGDVISVKYRGSKSAIQCAGEGRFEWFRGNIDPLIKDQAIDMYDRVLYVLPSGICRWTGNFDIGKRRIYTTDGARPKIAAHELAHTFGMQHGATAKPLQEHEYGDHSDILGGGQGPPVAQMNAPRAIKFGFIPPSAVQDVTSAGTYSIGAIEIDPARAKDKQVIRVYRTGAGNDAEYYYLSLRRPIGIDAKLAGYTHDEIFNKSYVDRLSVHRFKPDAMGYRDRMTYLVGLIEVGESFADQEHGVEITFNALSNDVAMVAVRLRKDDGAKGGQK